ncbi:hypothetical protein DOY81_004442 [Sarcophaga bullata]|nr:hypothetical protein DOY81_004442 [Sarcophaga bullata]
MLKNMLINIKCKLVDRGRQNINFAIPSQALGLDYSAFKVLNSYSTK